MVRRAASKVMWVGRATVFLVGLAVILAVVFGFASAALSATGGTFILGQANTAGKPTSLLGNVVDATKSALVVTNGRGGSALELKVGPAITAPADKTTPPMKVDSQAKVANLNADKLDDREASSFANATHTHSGADITTGVIAEARIDGSIARDSEVVRGPGATYSNTDSVPGNSGGGVLVNVPGVGAFHTDCVSTGGRLYLDSASGFGGSWVLIDDGGATPSSRFVDGPTANWEISALPLTNPDRVVLDFYTPRMTVVIDHIYGIGATNDCYFTARAQVFQ